jgi:predicted DCC family thiol-disulfide oxidoreductase YuxK
MSATKSKKVPDSNFTKSVANHHLVFYDGQCGLCDAIVHYLIEVDKKKCFHFAPLQGKTAAQLLSALPQRFRQVDSLILIENYQSPNRRIFLFGKGALRICWLLGNVWGIIGALSFLPGFLYNWIYRLVARQRYRWSAAACKPPLPFNRDRFLP